MLIEFKMHINLPNNKTDEEIVEECKMILHDAVGMLTMYDLTIHNEIKS